MKKLIFTIYSVFSAVITFGQQLSGGQFPQGHSHNDYLQPAPFTLAFQQKLGSVEADVFLVNDTLFVAHSRNEIDHERTFERLYIQPILKAAAKNGGKITGIKHCSCWLI